MGKTGELLRPNGESWCLIVAAKQVHTLQAHDESAPRTPSGRTGHSLANRLALHCVRDSEKSARLHERGKRSQSGARVAGAFDSIIDTSSIQ